jgi:DNA (cytosine-5)-methyltransferase 1
MARLHGFPDWFRLHRTKWHGARQIGNAVPPPLARAAGDAVADAMKLRRRRPQKAVTLGSPRLLQMTVQEASRYWNVTPPAGKRDRKSGQKKRTQLETQRDERLVAAE